MIIGLIAKKDFIEPAVKRLESKFGIVDFVSPVFEFNQTDYYFPEMGQPLYRQFVSFKKLISPAFLCRVKGYTNKLEMKFLKGNKRQVNIDPGYLSFSKLILASAKDFSHRIYLDKGIYAEVTLIYQDKEYKDLMWTYPDYKTDDYKQVLKKIRDIYASQIKEGKSLN